MTRDNIPPELLRDVKNYLNITWDDQTTDDKIRGLIASAAVYLDTIGGEGTDYTTDGLGRTLLFDYVRYARDEALDVFENNYGSMLTLFANGKAVERYVQTPKPPEA